MRPPRRTPALVALVGLATTVALVLAACAIPTDDEPRLLAADITTVAAPSSAPADSANSASVYLGQGRSSEKLVSVRRGLDGTPTPERVLEALLAGATQADFDRGYLSNIPEASELLGTELDDGELTIDLNEAFYTREGDQARNAFAQVVLTVTGLDTFTITRVRFQKAGEPIQAFTAPAGGAKDVVTRADYAALDPRVG